MSPDPWIIPGAHHPFPFIRSDALTIDPAGFDAIHVPRPVSATSGAGTPTGSAIPICWVRPASYFGAPGSPE